MDRRPGEGADHGYGYAREYGMERRLRDSWGLDIAGGTVDIQKINIAGALVNRRFNQCLV